MATSTSPSSHASPSRAVTAVTAIAIEDEDDEAIANAIFADKHGADAIPEKDLQSTCISGLLCCIHSRCLGVTCVVLPCILFLLISWLLPATQTTSKRRLLIASAVPPGIYACCAILVVFLLCRRQIARDTENAHAAHRYLNAHTNRQKVAVTVQKASQGAAITAQVTTASRFALFLKAAKTGCLEDFQWCIDNGQNVDQVDGLGRSALHWAALEGNDEIVAILLRNGVSINLQDTLNALSPLHYATFYGHVKTTRLLTEAGANLLLQDNRKMNPLQLAEMASLRLATVQPSHQMIIKFLRIAMKDDVTPPLQHITGLTVVNLVERQMMIVPEKDA